MNEPPIIAGLERDQSHPQKTAFVCRADTPPEAFYALLEWLPQASSLDFYDADYPSPSDPGAFFKVRKVGNKLDWMMGNHGWSGDWRSTTQDAVVARLLANRLTPYGNPARLTVQRLPR